MGPTGVVVFEKRGQAVGWFRLIATQPGTYIFTIIAHASCTEKAMATIAIGKGNETCLEGLKKMKDEVRVVQSFLMDTQTESTSRWLQQITDIEALDMIDTRLICCCLLQLVLLIALSCFQVNYLKGLLSNRDKEDAGAYRMIETSSPSGRASPSKAGLRN